MGQLKLYVQLSDLKVDICYLFELVLQYIAKVSLSHLD